MRVNNIHVCSLTISEARAKILKGKHSSAPTSLLSVLMRRFLCYEFIIDVYIVCEVFVFGPLFGVVHFDFSSLLRFRCSLTLMCESLLVSV